MATGEGHQQGRRELRPHPPADSAIAATPAVFALELEAVSRGAPQCFTDSVQPQPFVSANASRWFPTIVYLHAIHSDIAFTGPRVARMHTGQCYETAAIEKASISDIGNAVEIEIFPQDDLLAWRVFRATTNLGKALVSALKLRQHLELVKETLRCFDRSSARQCRAGNLVEINSTPSDSAMRRLLPNWLMMTLWPGYPCIFSNKSAGPPGGYFPFSEPICLRGP